MTPDVNVLISAFRQDHPYHVPARTWLEDALAASTAIQSLSILPMVASGFLRLATHPKVFIDPAPIQAAQAFLSAVLDSPHVVLLPLGSEWTLFEQICIQYKLRGNAIPDAWIAAAAQSHHLRLVTFDKGFKRLLKASCVTVLQPV
jgi:uncharacterized protein